MTEYGKEPIDCGNLPLPEWKEFMHYMYLPISMPGSSEVRIPERLQFASKVIWSAIDREDYLFGAFGKWQYIYLTMRRGFATPGNPLNRPGWHSDGFGTEDVNYVWTDRFPTDFAVQAFQDVSADHEESIRQFTEQIALSREYGEDSTIHYPDNQLLRLDSAVIHRAPEIPAPGGVRSFLKVSFSNSKYNLAGNSHNFLFDYDWDMFDRNEVRNDPARAEADGVIK